ncbi:uncharacterized protein J4E84_008335 [Alternaria hordeiaustralica]|uniref:uncharacterized protein n=1 Tax=Alternaria hordeiaustralica TaxID=1187925 RepID=UPI0020C48935|nr:uncharacterized protein J4E84_008335 [Alternaria hordeiaustralica]KAI4679307.1 hypothetical protein J4E84_008335 [Alternaria hordeiaustralica]
MRLLYTTTDGGIAWTKDIIRSEDMPRYAILSHTWGEQEVTFDDLRSLGSMNDVEARNEAIARKREGWDKIRFCAAQAKHDGIDHFWVDTCCIDKANNTELSEAINSMFRWYQNSQKCYVFLTDVKGKSSDETGEPSSRWKAAFKTSRWFTRGWTLQELLAPRLVEFFAADGAWLGDKESMEQVIHEVTRIPIEALSGSDLSAFNVDVRLSWALSRQTTREEDGAYCLLGIFDCHLPLIYGEGKESAFKRLRKEIQGEERLRKISSWLLAPDPTINYHKAHEQRQANTGLWLLEGAGFKRWKLSAASKLWLYGIPGCGKTILSSTIIEHLQQYCDEDDRMVTVYFYFDFNDAQKRDPGLMLRSLLRQLLEHSVMIPEGVDALFSSCGNGRQPPSVYALLEVAPQVIRMFTHVYVVLDALDECTQRPQLMDMLETMFGWQLGTLHLLVTSRKERDIEMSLENYVKKDEIICLQSDVVDQDISLFVQERLREDKRLAKWKMNARIVQEIEATLMRGARGMFRWASLAALPPTLDQTYDRILTAISEDDCVYAKRILQWLTFSTRPLYLEEIAEAVAIDVTREPGFDRDEVLVDPLEALDICSSLVAITTIKQGPSEQYSMQEVESHEALARACLIYLNQIPRNFVPEFDQFDFELAQYSAESCYASVLDA